MNSECDNTNNESNYNTNKQKPPYFCPICSIETKANQKYKHLKRHAYNDQAIKELTTSLLTTRSEIQILKNELKKYEILNTEKQKELAALELSLLKKLNN